MSESIEWGPYVSEPYEKVKSRVEDRNRIQNELPAKGHVLLESSRYWSAISFARDSLKHLGQLTSVDGATLVTYDLTVLAFGTKIKPISSTNKPDVVIISEPFESSTPNEHAISKLGWGTRHQSAVQFVFDQKDSLALVASQDGKFSAFAWDEELQKVAVLQHAEFAFL